MMLRSSLRPVTRALALASLAAVALVAACSSDSATSPRASAVTNAQAYATFDSVASDSARRSSAGDFAVEGRFLAAVGVPIVDRTVTINGQAETFHTMAMGLRQVDSTGAPKDSTIGIIGWRGAVGQEMFMAWVNDSAGMPGYPEGTVTYVKDTTVYYATNAAAGATMTANIATSGGSCTPTSPAVSDVETPVFVAAASGCQGARVSGTFSATLAGMTSGSMTFQLSLSQESAVHFDLKPVALL